MIQIRKRENAYKWISAIILAVIVFMVVLIANGVNAQEIGGFFDSKVVSSNISGDNYVVAGITGSEVLVIGSNDVAPPTTTIAWNNQPSSITITQKEITQQVLNEAKILQNAWNDTTNYTLYQSAPSGGFLLSTQGGAYFSTVVPYLSTISPNILSAYSPNITIKKNIFTQGAQSQIDSLISGTILDLTPLATTLGIPRRLLTSILWIALMIFVIVILTQAVKSYKPALLFSFPMIACGALIGWLPWQLALGLGFLMGAMTWYIFTYEKSPS